MSNRGTERSKPVVFLDIHDLYVGQNVYSVDGGSTIARVSEGVVMHAVDYFDKKADRPARLFLLTLEPGRIYPSMKVAGDDTCIVSIEWGSGTWEGTDNQGNTVTHELSDDLAGQNTHIYDRNWSGVWRAGEDGLKVLELQVFPETLNGDE